MLGGVGGNFGTDESLEPARDRVISPDSQSGAIPDYATTPLPKKYLYENTQPLLDRVISPGFLPGVFSLFSILHILCREETANLV